MRILEELRALYEEAKDFQEAIKCCHEKKQRIERVFPENHPTNLRAF